MTLVMTIGVAIYKPADDITQDIIEDRIRKSLTELLSQISVKSNKSPGQLKIKIIDAEYI